MSAAYRFRFDQDYLAAAFAHYRRVRGWYRWMAWLAPAVALGSALLGVFALRRGEYPMVGVFVFLALFWAAYPWIRGWQFRRSARRSPHLGEEVVVRVAEEGLRITTASSDVKLGWPAITEAWRFADGLLVCQGPRVFYWLADRAIAEASAAEAGRLLDEHVAGGVQGGRGQVK
ncbi:MAG TPA: hypothetical protein VKU40_03300 [Thermoanaerobaculia bacterium]|nr:hypothetical protein [Thermoanaerobaculia bacterium]